MELLELEERVKDGWSKPLIHLSGKATAGMIPLIHLSERANVVIIPLIHLSERANVVLINPLIHLSERTAGNTTQTEKGTKTLIHTSVASVVLVRDTTQPVSAIIFSKRKPQKNGTQFHISKN
jgi:hypothetical protein